MKIKNIMEQIILKISINSKLKIRDIYHKIKLVHSMIVALYIWDKVFKNGPNKILRLPSTNF